MSFLIYILSFSIVIPTVIILATVCFSYRSPMDREKNSPFECGFDPKNSARLPFSTRFFLLVVIFLMFDIEIALLMPMPLCLMKGFSFSVMSSGFVFFLVLLIGLLHEWREGSLDWTS